MAGSSVTNSGAGFIGGIHGLAGTPLILNGATIAAPDFSHPGIQLDQGGGQVANSGTGTITAFNNAGILSYGQTAIVNRGAIAALGAGNGIQLGRLAPRPVPALIGAIANYGTISGIVGISVLSPFAATRIVDAGAIVGSGGTAVSFASGTNTLALEAGYSLQGAVVGGAGTTNTLELDGTNGIASLVTVDFNLLTLSNVPTIAFAPGDYNFATLRITNLAALPGQIAGFTGLNDAIDFAGLLDTKFDVTVLFDAATRVLTVNAENGSVALQLAAADYIAYPGRRATTATAALWCIAAAARRRSPRRPCRRPPTAVSRATTLPMS
jgi:hypothetical protein